MHLKQDPPVWPGRSRTFAWAGLGCRLPSAGCSPKVRPVSRETPLNPVSQERLQAKKQDLFLLRRRLHKSEGGWNLACNLPGLGAFNPARPAPQVRDSCSRWGSSATSWPRRHRLPLQTEPAAAISFFFFSASISLLHTIVQWKHGGRCFMEGALPRPILNEIQGIYLKNIYHTFNVMISLGLYVHLLGLT